MIRVTERAAAGLDEMLSANRAPKDRGVKLVPNQTGGVEMTIDRPRKGDEVVDRNDRTLLIVDASISPRLDGVVLDIASDERMDVEGPRFVLRPAEP